MPALWAALEPRVTEAAAHPPCTELEAQVCGGDGRRDGRGFFLDFGQ